MAILTMPSSPRFKAGQFRLRSNTLAHTSPEDLTTQTVERVGTLWSLEVSLPPLHQDDPDAEAWASFLANLNGRAGRFYAGDPLRLAPRGSAASTPGTPKVAGASQSGKTLAIDGAAASAIGYLRVGDYFAYDTPSGGRSLHKLTAQADTDADGEVTLAFAPAITERPADNADILVAPATCIMMLVDDDQAVIDYSDYPFYKIAFAAVQARNLG